MDKNDTHQRSAAEQPKKSDTPGASTEKGQAGSEALSLQNTAELQENCPWKCGPDAKECLCLFSKEMIERLTKPIKWGYKLPETSGFKMARRV